MEKYPQITEDSIFDFGNCNTHNYMGESFFSLSTPSQSRTYPEEAHSQLHEQPIMCKTESVISECGSELDMEQFKTDPVRPLNKMIDELFTPLAPRIQEMTQTLEREPNHIGQSISLTHPKDDQHLTMKKMRPISPLKISSK